VDLSWQRSSPGWQPALRSRKSSGGTAGARRGERGSARRETLEGSASSREDGIRGESFGSSPVEIPQGPARKAKVEGGAVNAEQAATAGLANTPKDTKIP
jgi:hypothetical protein